MYMELSLCTVRFVVSFALSVISYSHLRNLEALCVALLLEGNDVLLNSIEN
jgi:hypothetical protein